MLKFIVIGFVLMSFAAAAQKKLLKSEQVDFLRTLRRLQATRRRASPDAVLRHRKDGSLTCNSCSYSGNGGGCQYVDQVCAPGDICAHIWKNGPEEVNFNGCIHPGLCEMLEEDSSCGFTQIHCCYSDLCNW